MCLYRIDGDKEFVGDFPRAEPECDELQHLQFARRDACSPERIRASRKCRERLSADKGRMTDPSAHTLSHPNADPGEEESDNADIQFPRVVDDEESIFEQAQRDREKRKRHRVK